VNVLETIAVEKRGEVERLRPQTDELKRAAAARTEFRDFAGALQRGGGVALIAEIKKASPSAGLIASDFDAVRIARAYEKAGASALSVLTDEKFFQGRIESLRQIREAVKLPLLRKDFILDEVQVYESAASGADAILLIVAILDDAQLKGFRELAEQMHLAALVEVHDEPELERAIASGATIIGINNRDLRDFSVNLETTERLCVRIIRGSRSVVTTAKDGLAEARPSTRPLVVAESGINTRADVERVARARVDAILVGEALMKSGDVIAKVKELLTANGHE
jgi:indole-3-glycerol phosphate synthase